MSARFTTNATTDDLRADLIDEDIDSLTLDLIEAIITTCWSDFEPIARRYLAARYANDHDVWDEATDRGYFTADHDD